MGCFVPPLIAQSTSSASEWNSSPIPALRSQDWSLTFVRHSACSFHLPIFRHRAFPNCRRLYVGVPMRAPQLLRIGSGRQVANRPLAPAFAPQISFMQEENFLDSSNRSLSPRASGLLAVLADQTKGSSAFGLRRLLASQLADTGSLRYQWDMLRCQFENCAGGTSTRKFNSKIRCTLASPSCGTLNCCNHTSWLEAHIVGIDQWSRL